MVFWLARVTPRRTGVNQDDSAIHFRRKDYPVAVNQNAPAGAVVQTSGLRIVAVAEIQIALPLLYPAVRLPLDPFCRSRVWLTA